MTKDKEFLACLRRCILKLFLISEFSRIRNQVTTDPIELWAAPESRSRVERKFFDETFRPFYRTEQIIIHAKDLPTVSLENLTRLLLESCFH